MEVHNTCEVVAYEDSLEKDSKELYTLILFFYITKFV